MITDIRPLLEEREPLPYRMFKALPIGETGYELSIQNSGTHYCSQRDNPVPALGCIDFEIAILSPEGRLLMRHVSWDEDYENRTVVTPPLMEVVDHIVGSNSDDVWGWVPAETVAVVLHALHKYLTQEGENANA